MPQRSRCVFECDQFDILHRFPKPELSSLEKFEQWKEVVGRRLEDKDDNYIYTNYRICNHHFEDRFFYPQSKRLAKTAYPTLNLDPAAAVQASNIADNQAEGLIEIQPMHSNPGRSSEFLVSQQIITQIPADWSRSRSRRSRSRHRSKRSRSRSRHRSHRSRSRHKDQPGTGAFRTSPGGAGEPPPAPPPPLFLPPHLSHLSQHLNHLSQPFFPLKGWGAPCPCCPKEEARSSSVAELRRKAHELSAALLHSLASFQSRALLPLPLPLPLPPLPLLPHDAPPTSQAHEPPKHLD